ncbi:hypothetical protein ALC56_01172, partial [Trachymyrmex septentrionalis]
FSKQKSWCEEIFQNEYRTDEERLEVLLPFCEDPTVLRESKTNTLKQLCSMEGKFRKDPGLQTRYIKFMKEYVVLGHVRQCVLWKDNPDKPAIARYYIVMGEILKSYSGQWYIILIKIHQQRKFLNKLHNLQQNQLLDSHSKILALNTMIDQIEATLNSRPLCPLNNFPDELDVLTSGYFLIGTSFMALPEKSILDIPQNYSNRYQLLTQLQ